MSAAAQAGEREEDQGRRGKLTELLRVGGIPGQLPMPGPPGVQRPLDLHSLGTTPRDPRISEQQWGTGWSEFMFGELPLPYWSEIKQR